MYQNSSKPNLKSVCAIFLKYSNKSVIIKMNIGVKTNTAMLWLWYHTLKKPIMPFQKIFIAKNYNSQHEAFLLQSKNRQKNIVSQRISENVSWLEVYFSAYLKIQVILLTTETYFADCFYILWKIINKHNLLFYI